MKRIASFFVLLTLAPTILWALSVDPSSGSVTTSVGISVPPWHGVAPAISLVQNGHGNGVLGFGWRLNAASTIYRSSAKGPIPQMTASDVFYLDGEELVPCGGVAPWSSLPKGSGDTIYCLKHNNDLRILRKPDATWTVTGKDGTVLLLTPRIRRGNGEITRWSVSTVTTTTQRTATYHYGCDAGTGIVSGDGGCLDPAYPYLTSIEWGEGKFRAEFVYQANPRPDVLSFGTGGGLSKQRFLLEKIVVSQKSGGSSSFAQDHAYELSYRLSVNTRRSLLEKVDEVGRSGGTTSTPIVTGDTTKEELP
jgi:hypothetical protein